MPFSIDHMFDGRMAAICDVLRGAAPIAFDFVAPVVLYYSLRAFGESQASALLLSGVPTLVFALLQIVRSRHVDPVAFFVLTLIAVGAATAFITGDIRILLAKGSVLSAATAVSFAVSLRMRRPLVFTFARALLQRTPLSVLFHVERWDDLWETDATFRHRWRVATAIWIVGLASAAAIHIALAYRLPVDAVPVTVAVVNVAMFALIQIVQQIYLTRSHLWGYLAELDAETPSAATGTATGTGTTHQNTNQ